MIEQITPLVLTYNEAPNISRTLDRLTWATRIVVIDSGSTDETLEIVRSYPQATVIHRPFDDHASQWNFGNDQVSGNWILSLDADYEISEALVAELQCLNPSPSTIGYRAKFVYRIFGHPLRGSLYPARIVLYRKDKAHYKNEGHTQRLMVNGDVAILSGEIFHDDRKPLGRWIESQRRYAQLEAKYLFEANPKLLGWPDRIRLVGWPAPLAVFVYTLICKGCLVNGWRGWYYALQRLLAELMIALELIDRRLRRAAK